jgi:hypothetical protein
MMRQRGGPSDHGKSRLPGLSRHADTISTAQSAELIARYDSDARTTGVVLAIAGTENTSAEKKNAAFLTGYKTKGRRPREIECDSLVTYTLLRHLFSFNRRNNTKP